jgi:hypothetical protein
MYLLVEKGTQISARHILQHQADCALHEACSHVLQPITWGVAPQEDTLVYAYLSYDFQNGYAEVQGRCDHDSYAND